MPSNRMMSEVDAARAKLGVYAVIILLTLDVLNPVKIFLHVFNPYGVETWHIVGLTVVLFLYTFVSEMKQLLYFAVKVFFHSILSIFFRDVDVIGLENIPKQGPVIFTGNHANQFIDAVAILASCDLKISYLMAEKSWNRNIIGHIAWAMGAVPVKRAQDSAKVGSGKVCILKPKSDKDLIVVQGFSTKFSSEINVGDKIRLAGSEHALRVKNVVNDDELLIENVNNFSYSNESKTYDIFKRVDLNDVYERVLNCLATSGCIAIFPEGGSHDRTDLLPLKAGVALIAYSALERDDLNISIIPVGLNYFRAHRFRGRAIVEYGTPSYIKTASLEDFRRGGEDRRAVCNELLERIEDSMRSVVVTTPDYKTLQMVYTARRLFQRKEPTTEGKQDLNRRFAEGYKLLMSRRKGNLPKEWLELRQRLYDYMKELNDLGIRDYQVRMLAQEKYDEDDYGDSVLREMRIPSQILWLIFTFSLALVPALTLNLPVGLFARLYAERKRKKALKNSRVKVQAKDVMLSEKVVLCIVLVPTLWMAYGFGFYFFTSWDGPSISLAILSLPFFSYYGIMATESGMINFRDIRPYFLRLFPSTRKRLNELPVLRKNLQVDIRLFVKELGPSLGEIYFNKDLDWKDFQLKKRQNTANKTD